MLDDCTDSRCIGIATAPMRSLFSMIVVGFLICLAYACAAFDRSGDDVGARSDHRHPLLQSQPAAASSAFTPSSARAKGTLRLEQSLNDHAAVVIR
jgi:hypothetical protein